MTDGRENTEQDNNGRKQATGKQITAFVFILALAAKMFLLPIFLLRATGRDMYIAVAINCGVDLIALGLLIAALYLSGENDFFALMTALFGRVGAKIASALAGLYLFLKLNIAVSETLAFYGTNMNTDFDTTLMIAVFAVFLAAAAKHTLRALCRLNELIVPLVALCLTVLIAIMIMTGLDFGNILPAVQSASRLGGGVMRHAAWVGDFTPLVLFIGRTKIKKATGYFVAGSGAIGSAVAVFFAIAMSAAFGNAPDLADNTTNLSSILQFTSGNVYGRIDMLSAMLWSISVFINAALLFYATNRCFVFALGKATFGWVSLGISVALYAVQVFALVDQTVFATAIVSAACSGISACFTLVIPTAAVIGAAAARKKEVNRDRTEKTADI